MRRRYAQAGNPEACAKRGLSIDDAVWNHSTFSKNRDRLLEHAVVPELFAEVARLAEQRGLLSTDHLSVDGTLIQAWASHKSFRPKDEGPGGIGRNQEHDFHGEQRKNDTPASTTDSDARLYRKSANTAAVLCYQGHTVVENRHGWLCVPCSTRKRANDTRAMDLADAAVLHGGSTADTIAVFELLQDSQLLSRHLLYFAPGRDLQLPDPALSGSLFAHGGGYRLTVEATRFARGVWVDFGDLDATLSDNAFDLLPGQSMTLHVRSDASIDALRTSLHLHSLADATSSPGGKTRTADHPH